MGKQHGEQMATIPVEIEFFAQRQLLGFETKTNSGI
jgi:hypothetical protein